MKESKEEVRNPFLGEIEAEIVGMQHHEARIHPGEQINLEREPKNTHDRHAIKVANGKLEPVGYLPKSMASWLAPLIDKGKIHLDGYVPKESKDTGDETSRPVNLMVFQGKKGRRLLEKSEPQTELETLHQTVLQAYQNAQGYRNPELIVGLAKGLQPLGNQELMPEIHLPI